MEAHKVFAIKLPITLYKDIKEKADNQEMFVSEYIRKVLIAYPEADELKIKAQELLKKTQEDGQKIVWEMVAKIKEETKEAVKEALKEEVK